MQPEELALNKTGIINETIASVLEGKYTHKKIRLFYIGGIQKTPIFIPADIT